MAKLHLLVFVCGIFTTVCLVEILAQSCTTYMTDTTADDYDSWTPWIPKLTGGSRLHFRVKGADTLKIALADEPKLDSEIYYVYVGITQDKAGGGSTDDASIYRSAVNPPTSEPLSSADSGLFTSGTGSFIDLELSYSEASGTGTLALGPKDFTLPTVSYMDSSPLGIVWIGLDSDTTAAEWQICDPIPKLISGTGLGSSSITGVSGNTEARDAYDGEISSSNDNCATSGSNDNPQWRFAFSGSLEKIVSLVVIYARESGGSGASRVLENTEVTVGSVSCRTNQCGADITSAEDGYSAGCPITKQCTTSLVGNSVTIRKPGTSVILNLCEVEIYGIDVTEALQSELYFSALTYNVLESETVDIVVTRDIVAESTCSRARITTTQDSATDTADYTAITQFTGTFSEGELSEFRTLTTVDDDNYEGDERLTVMLSDVQGGYFGTPIMAEVIIQDDDALYSFCQTKYTILESDLNGDVELCREGYLMKQGTVDIQVRTGFGTPPLATPISDYPVFATTTVMFPITMDRVMFNVEVVDDPATEGVETFMLELTNAQTGNVSPTGATTTICITDEDGTTYALDKSVYSVKETVGGSVVPICVERTGYPGNVATVRLVTSGLTAVEGADFEALNLVLTFGSGDPMKCTEINIIDDDIVESVTETFEVELEELDSLGMLSSSGPNKLVVTIEDDDANIELVTKTLTVSERDDSTVTIVARYTGVITSTVTAVLTAVSDTAQLGEDFESIVGFLSFTPTSTTDSLTVEIIDDEINEPFEQFFVRLSYFAGGLVLDEAVINILPDNEGTIVFASTLCSVSEKTSQLSITVRRYENVNEEETVGISTIDDTARSGRDYTSTTNSITFDERDTSEVFIIQIRDDSDRDGDKSFMVRITDQSTGEVLDSITCIIQDDDAEYAFSSSRYQVLESERYVQVTVTKSGNSDSSGSVDIFTRDGTARGGSDYVAITSRNIDFAVGETERPVQVFILQDNQDEGNIMESFSVELSNAVNGIIVSPGIAEVHIVEQQATYRIESLTYTVSEAAPSGSVLLVVIRETYDGIQGTVDIRTSDETASAPADYTSVQTTLIFAEGQTRAFVSIFIQEDNIPEDTEVFRVTIIGATGGVPSPTQSAAVITITDDDVPTRPSVTTIETTTETTTTEASGPGLTTAGIIGIAIGGVTGGLVLLGIVGFVLMRGLNPPPPPPRPPPAGQFGQGFIINQGFNQQGFNNPSAFGGFPGSAFGGGDFGNGATFGNPAFQPNFFQQNGNQFYPQF